MRRQLSFVRYATRVLPLCLVDALPDRVLTQVHVEGLPEADACSFHNRVLNATLIVELVQF